MVKNVLTKSDISRSQCPEHLAQHIMKHSLPVNGASTVAESDVLKIAIARQERLIGVITHLSPCLHRFLETGPIILVRTAAIATYKALKNILTSVNARMRKHALREYACAYVRADYFDRYTTFKVKKGK